ncbi:MAG: hypothetical protein QM786_14795 [Breznakibacter sp.]
MQYIAIKNNQSIPSDDIPVLDYPSFFELNTSLVGNPSCHCVNYYGYRSGSKVKLICAIADDNDHMIFVSSCMVPVNAMLASFSEKRLCFERFEREIHENFGIGFSGHPWLKPVRYAHNRADRDQTMANYPFYTIESEELHEVGVGPIHAGVIEPGHFRFVCNGKQILHLEIQLGYQHRGIEQLMLTTDNRHKRAILAESIAGDTTIGHTTAFSQAWENLCGYEASADTQFSRSLALELERMAVHTGDMAAISGDIAYQLGNSVFGRLRTPIINYMQEWGGNRLGKGFVRPAQNRFPFTPQLAERLYGILIPYERDFHEMADKLFTLPSALSRLERTGTISDQETSTMGFVGMAARTTGVPRDVRRTHPSGLFAHMEHEPIVLTAGDVHARADLRRREVDQSMAYVRQWISDLPQIEHPRPLPDLRPNQFTISLVEGWRGEICHCAITDHNGNLAHYKIKDPSFHNWMALALAVRNNEISDFPICNKSFNLSYSGHDL